MKNPLIAQGVSASHPSESNRRPADYESAALPTELGWRGDALAGINEGQDKVNRVASALSCGARQRLARCPGGCMLAMAATGAGVVRKPESVWRDRDGCPVELNHQLANGQAQRCFKC